MTETLHLQRVFQTGPDRVWHALTDPTALSAWFWPPTFGTTADADLRVGGAFRIESAKVGIGVGGAYTEIDQPRRMVLTWRWNGEDHETLVTVDLAPSGEGVTELTLRQEPFIDAKQRDEHVEGWSDCLDRLPGWLAEQPGSRSAE